MFLLLLNSAKLSWIFLEGKNATPGNTIQHKSIMFAFLCSVKFTSNAPPDAPFIIPNTVLLACRKKEVIHNNSMVPTSIEWQAIDIA